MENKKLLKDFSLQLQEKIRSIIGVKNKNNLNHTVQERTGHYEGVKAAYVSFMVM